MSARSITHFLKVNSNLTSAARETREFRLPRMNPFPKLDRRVVAARVERGGPSDLAVVGARGYRGTAGIAPTSLGGGEPLPEMVTELLDPSARYGAENVRRAGAAAPLAPWSGACTVRRGELQPPTRVNGPRPGSGLGQWMQRILGGHQAARR